MERLYFILSNYVILLVFTLLMLLIGWGLKLILKVRFCSSFYTEIFTSILLGAVSYVILLATIFTSFQTLQLALLVILWAIYRYYFYIQEVAIVKDITYDVITLPKLASYCKINYKKALLTLLGLTLIFTWNIVHRTQSNNSFSILNFHGEDITHYSGISYYLLLSGQEKVKNAYTFIDPSYKGIELYHFTELWLNAGITLLFQNLSAVNMLCVLTPLFLFIFWLGILSIFVFFEVDRYIWLTFLITLLLIPSTNLSLEFYKKFTILKYIEAYNGSIITQPWKMGFAYVVVIGSFLAILHKHYPVAIYLLASLLVFNIGFLPLSLTIVVGLLIHGYTFKIVSQKHTIRTSLYVLLFFLSFISVYIFFKSSNFYGQPSATNIYLAYLWNRKHILVDFFINILVLSLPVLILTSIITIKYLLQYKEILFLLGVPILSSIGSALFTLFFNFTDIWQIKSFYNPIFFTCFIITFAIWGIKLLNQANMISKMYILLFLLGLFITNMYQIMYFYKHPSFMFENQSRHNIIYFEKINQILPRIQNPIGFTLYSIQYYKSKFPSLTLSSLPDIYLGLKSNSFTTLRLSDYFLDSLKLDKQQLSDRYALTSTSFGYQFWQKNKQKFKNTDDFLKAIIKKYQIEYGFIAKDYPIPLFMKQIAKEIITSDEGEKFVHFDLQKLNKLL